VIKIALLLIVLAGIEDRESLRFSYCTEQGFDDSCGLSVLACLMDKYWSHPCDELSLVADYLASKPDQEQLKVSFAVMADILRKNGFIFKALTMDYEGLCRAVENYAPLIVHYSKPEGHFALALWAEDRWLLAADPAEGCVFIERNDFQDRWSGAVLAAIGTKSEKNLILLGDAVKSAESRRDLLEKISPEESFSGRSLRRW